MRPARQSDDSGVGRWLGLAARRVVVSIVGGVILLAGVVMIVTPGPGLVVVAAGLAVLSTEFNWAHRALVQVRRRSRTVYLHAKARMQSRSRPRP